MFPAKHFYYFSKIIGIEWKLFASKLNVSDIEIQNIDSSKSISVLEKPFQMLWLWFCKQENASWELFIDKLNEYGNQTWINEANSITEKLMQICSLSTVSENIGAMRDCRLNDYDKFLSELLSKRWFVFGVEMQLDLIELNGIRNSKTDIDRSYDVLRKWGYKTNDTSWRECRKQLTYNKEWNSVIRIMDSYIIVGNDKKLREEFQQKTKKSVNIFIKFYQTISQYLNEELTILSEHLEIDKVQLELIDQVYPTAKEKAFEILLLWDNQQQHAPKLDDLKVIFQRIGRHDLFKKADKLFKSCESNDTDNIVSIEDLEKPLDDFKLVLSGKIANCWYEVGIALSVSKNKLEELRSSNSKEADKSYDMLTLFGRQSCSPTWKTVKTALEKLEHKLIVREIGQHLRGNKIF